MTQNFTNYNLFTEFKILNSLLNHSACARKAFRSKYQFLIRFKKGLLMIITDQFYQIQMKFAIYCVNNKHIIGTLFSITECDINMLCISQTIQ